MPRAAEPLPAAVQSMVVATGDLASALDVSAELSFPAVFATSRMIGLMEVAAAHCLVPLLEPGELSVGVVVEVRHTAPTLVGATVTASARFIEIIGGKLYRFEVVAEDAGGEIGRGLHDRAIVRASRLLERARKRHAQGSGG